MEKLLKLANTSHVAETLHHHWRWWIDQLQQLKHEFNCAVQMKPSCGEPLSSAEVIRVLSQAFQTEDPIVVTDVGQHQMFAAQYFDVGTPRSFLTSGGLGTMGFGLPAAIGAAYGAPKRPTVLLAGDGGFQMTIEELGFLAVHQLPVLIVILDNATLGMVRQWQELFFSGHYSQSMLPNNPDFVAIAGAYGIAGQRVRQLADLKAAVAQFKTDSTPLLLHVEVQTMENVFPMIPAGKGPKEIIMPGFSSDLAIDRDAQ